VRAVTVSSVTEEMLTHQRGGTGTIAVNALQTMDNSLERRDMVVVRLLQRRSQGYVARRKTLQNALRDEKN